MRALFFPFVCLFASSAFPRRPALPIFCCHVTPFLSPFSPESCQQTPLERDMQISGTGKQTAGSTVPLPEHKKTYLSSGRKAASLAAPSLPPQSMKVSSHPALIPHQGSRHCGRSESTTRPVASAHRGQREEDDSPLNGFHSGCV